MDVQGVPWTDAQAECGVYHYATLRDEYAKEYRKRDYRTRGDSPKRIQKNMKVEKFANKVIEYDTKVEKLSKKVEYLS